MSHQRKSSAAPILVTLAIVLVTLLAAYVGGYFWLGTWFDYDETAARVYPQAWMAKIFEPATRFETWLTGTQIWAQHFTNELPAETP